MDKNKTEIVKNTQDQPGKYHKAVVEDNDETNYQKIGVLFRMAVPSIFAVTLFMFQITILLLFLSSASASPDLIAGFGLANVLCNAFYFSIAFGFNSALDTLIS